jgi:hypothetical protein
MEIDMKCFPLLNEVRKVENRIRFPYPSIDIFNELEEMVQVPSKVKEKAMVRG